MSRAWFTQILENGIEPDFDDNIWRCHPQDQTQFSADYLPPAFLERLDRAPELGWRAAVEAGLPLLSEWSAAYTRDYFFASYRSDFVEDLDVGPESSVLDVGCGWGFASQRCLEKGALVVGTETATRRLRFCATRFGQQGFGDRFVGVELDANLRSPFRPRVFDAIIVSGVMEWLPTGALGRPEQIQFEFLRRCFAALKPSGRLYLAIENRIWARYFLGAPDLHTLQKWTSILPRPVARFYSRLRDHKDYRAYTYSLAGYLSLLKRAGYTSVAASYPRPDYVQPKEVQRLATDVPLASPLLALLAIVCHRDRWRPALFGRSYAFIARRD